MNANPPFWASLLTESGVYRNGFDGLRPCPSTSVGALFSTSLLKMLPSTPVKHFADAATTHGPVSRRQREENKEDPHTQRHFTAFTDEHLHCCETPSEELLDQASLGKISWEWEVGSSTSRIGLDSC